MKTTLLAGLTLLFVACSGPTELEDHPCPPQGTTLTYENFGRGFMEAHCQSCHASRSLDRRGAPAGHYFDTRDDVFRQRERIFVRSAADNTSMPLGPDDPPESERMKLADWLACGVP